MKHIVITSLILAVTGMALILISIDAEAGYKHRHKEYPTEPSPPPTPTPPPPSPVPSPQPVPPPQPQEDCRCTGAEDFTGSPSSPDVYEFYEELLAEPVLEKEEPKDLDLGYDEIVRKLEEVQRKLLKIQSILWYLSSPNPKG